MFAVGRHRELTDDANVSTLNVGVDVDKQRVGVGERVVRVAAFVGGDRVPQSALAGRMWIPKTTGTAMIVAEGQTTTRWTRRLRSVPPPCRRACIPAPARDRTFEPSRLGSGVFLPGQSQ